MLLRDTGGERLLVGFKVVRLSVLRYWLLIVNFVLLFTSEHIQTPSTHRQEGRNGVGILIVLGRPRLTLLITFPVLKES